MEPIREADVQTQPGKRLAEKTEKRGSKRPWMIAVIIAAVLVAAYLALCAYAGSLDTFYPNRHINGIDVGGLTVSEAQSALETRLPAQTITLVNEERQLQTTLTVAELGYTAESFAGTRSSGWTRSGTRRLFGRAGPILPRCPAIGPAALIGRT